MRYLWFIFILVIGVSSADEFKTTGDISPIISNTSGNVNIVYEKRKERNTIPRFEGQIKPISKRDYKDEKKPFLKGDKFNEFMSKNEGKIVYLDIWPYYTDEDLDMKEFDMFAIPKIFSVYNVPYEFDTGGFEYIIKGGSSDDFFFDGRQSARRIFGHFKILGIIGPQQGFFSVTIKPVSIEMIELLKNR